MELSEKQIKQGEEEITELTRYFFEEETWLIEKIAAEISTSGILFFESVEGEIDEGVHAYDGFENAGTIAYKGTAIYSTP